MNGVLGALARVVRRAPDSAQTEVPAFRLTRQGLLPNNEAGWQALKDMGSLDFSG